MITIETVSVNGRSDWYRASACVRGYSYAEFEKTRTGALMAILRKLAVKGYLKA